MESKTAVKGAVARKRQEQVRALGKRVQWVGSETAYLVVKFEKKWIIFQQVRAKRRLKIGGSEGQCHNKLNWRTI